MPAHSQWLLAAVWLVLAADPMHIRWKTEASFQSSIPVEAQASWLVSSSLSQVRLPFRANLRLRGGGFGLGSIFSRLGAGLRGLGAGSDVVTDPHKLNELDEEVRSDTTSTSRPKRQRAKESSGNEESADNPVLPIRGGGKRRKAKGEEQGLRPRSGDVSGAAAIDQPAVELDDTSIETLLSAMPSLQWDGQTLFSIPRGFVPDMNIDASFYANKALLKLVIAELLEKKQGGFLPAVRQLANVATLPGVVHSSIGMPDIHSGYGFAIGNVAAVDVDDPNAVVSPGGVGFDINCGVRLLRSNLKVADVEEHKEKLADALFDFIPVGVGEGSVLGRKVSTEELDAMLEKGMRWLEDNDLCWPEDRQFVEEGGCFKGAKPSSVSARAKARGRSQCGSLGSGNHYVEVQEVAEVFDAESAEAMGLREGMVVVMMHSGSRGLGHQVCTDALEAANRAMEEQGISVVDRQLACCRVASPEGQAYLAAMQAAANFAFINRSLMAKAAREAFGKVFGRSAAELEMHTVYDVAHNIAKLEQHAVGNATRNLLVHRKGATRAFGPGHPELPDQYRGIGQPVLVGGSMGTCSYVLTGTQGAMEKTFGSTCHGAGRAMSRTKAMRMLDSRAVLRDVQGRGCTTRVAKQGLAAEEAPESYKDVSDVVETCHAAGISKKCVRLRPLICIKG